MVKYGTRPVRDVVIFGIIVKYGTRPVRDVDIMQYYDKNMRHCVPPTNFTNLLWARSTSVRDVKTNNIF